MRLILILMALLAGMTLSLPVQAEPAAAEQSPPLTFKPVNVLEEQLIEAATNPEKRPGFMTSLLAADVYLATPEMPESEGARTIPAGEKLNILAAKLADGQTLPALFTSKDRIRDYFGPGVGFIQLSGRQAFELAGSNGIVLNPGSAYGAMFSGADVAKVLGKPVARVLDKPMSIMLGTAAKRPDKLIAKLEDVFVGDPRIKEVWLSFAVWSETGEEVWYLQVVTDAPDDYVRSLLENFGGKALLGDYPMDTRIVKPDELARVGIRIKP